MKPDQTRVGTLLIDTVSLLCQNGLNFATDIKVQGLLGITIDDNDIFLVHFNEILSDKQPSGSQQSEAETTVKPPEVVSCKIQDDESQAAEKSSIRRNGFGSSAALRHRYGTAARRRARQFGQRLRYQQNANKVYPDEENVFEDEKNDRSDYSDIKIETGEDALTNMSEEQDDVILVESDGGMMQHAEDIGSCVKEEETAEISTQDNRLMYHYANPYVHTSSFASEVNHSQDADDLQGPFSNASYTRDCDDDDVKEDIQMGPSNETWTVPDPDWQLSETYQTTETSFGYGSMYRQSRTLNSDQNSAYVGSRLQQRSIIICPPNTVEQKRRDCAPKRYARRNENFSRLTPGREHFQASTPISRNQQASSSSTSSQRPQMAPSGKMMYTVTKYVCSVCDATFNHHCTLLTHQVRKHGRQKNARRGRPSTLPF